MIAAQEHLYIECQGMTASWDASAGVSLHGTMQCPYYSWLARTGLVPYFVGATCGPREGVRLLTVAGFEVRHMTAIMHCPRVIAVAWAARLANQHSSRPAIRFLRWLGAWERLERWPTRYLSGYFVAWLAEKRG